MLIGHVAISILEHRLLDVELAPTLMGGLFPDVLDKTLCHVLRVTPSGRMWGHTALSLVASTGLVLAFVGRRKARAWALGYVGHLVADADDGTPLWYPFATYEFTPSPSVKEILQRFLNDRRRLAFELGLLIVALLLL
ncbi:MAG: metal-dependent hydrolase [Anaerolineae bacterium]